MHKYVSLWMKLRRLLNPFHRSDLGKNFSQQSGFIQQLERPSGMAFGQHASQFIADPLTGDLMNLRCELPKCLKGRWVNLIFEARRESHCPQHPQLIFAEPQLGIADGADEASVQIVFAADEIQNFVRERIKQQPVDGEIAALDILLRIAAEANLIRMAPI